MSAETDVNLLFAIPFDHSLFIEPELLGTVRYIQLVTMAARIEFPRDIPKSGITRGLLPPFSSPEGFGSHLPEAWGLRCDSQPKVTIEAVLVVVPFRTELAFDLDENQVGGKDLQDILSQVSTWFESFCHWLWISTAQSLDPVYPDPRVLHRRSKNIILAASTVGHSSLSSVGNLPLILTIDTGGPASERLVDERVLDLSLRRAGAGPPPMALELLASARMAARRGDSRRAFIDAGTAAEAAFSQILKLSPKHKKPLGGLAKLAQERGITIPADTQASLVDPRNDAVHRGQMRSGVDIARALEVAEELVSLVEKDLIPVSSLGAVNRPQRHNLKFIKSGSPTDVAS